MPPFSSQFKALALLTAIALLTACNPPNKPEKTAAAVASTPNTAASTTSNMGTSHAGHTMSNMTMASGTMSTEPAYVAEYKQTMTTMHEQMMAASKIANPDVAFVTGMIAHHQGAIDMAKIQLKYGKDSQMRALAETIIKAQQSEIHQMQTWLTQHKDEKAPANVDMPKMDMKNNDAMLQGITHTDPDIAFAKGMIPHHQGAIDMANTELKLGKDKTLLDLAKRIKSAQDPEIQQMQQWLDAKQAK